MTENTIMQTSRYMVNGTVHLYHNAKTATKLYNSAMYYCRRGIFRKKYNIPSYYELNNLFKRLSDEKSNSLYHDMCYAATSQQLLRNVDEVMTSYKNLRKAYFDNKITKYPGAPVYKEKDSLSTFTVLAANFSKQKLKENILSIKTLDFEMRLDPKLNNENIKLKEAQFKPLGNGKYYVFVSYEVEKPQVKEDLKENIFVSVDPGLNNLFTCVTNKAKVRLLIINGKPLKSINQYYNKNVARIKSAQEEAKTVKKNSVQLVNLTRWREKIMLDLKHKSALAIINYALDVKAKTIIVGKNKQQKNGSNMGRRTNQNFVTIPHAAFIETLKQKAIKYGIEVITTEESYTSQTSFPDKEKPIKENGNDARKEKGLSPINRRKSRGMFVSLIGAINADVNSAYQIMKKHILIDLLP